MKKKILLGVLFSMFIFGYANAVENYKEINERVKATFQREFANAEDVSWEDCNEFVRASFKLEDQQLTAYFNPEGDLLAVTRNIVSDQLPIHLLTALRREYAAYWITDLFEIYIQGETIYYVTLHDADREKVLKSSGDFWELCRTKKTGL